MINFLAIISTVNALFPAIVSSVGAIEAALPQGGQGATKLGILKGMLQAAYTQEQTVAASFETVWPALQPVIAGVVAITTKGTKVATQQS